VLIKVIEQNRNEMKSLFPISIATIWLLLLVYLCVGVVGVVVGWLSGRLVVVGVWLLGGCLVRVVVVVNWVYVVSVIVV